jgi:hypothetical protein
LPGRPAPQTQTPARCSPQPEGDTPLPPLSQHSLSSSPKLALQTPLPTTSTTSASALASQATAPTAPAILANTARTEGDTPAAVHTEEEERVRRALPNGYAEEEVVVEEERLRRVLANGHACVRGVMPRIGEEDSPSAPSPRAPPPPLLPVYPTPPSRLAQASPHTHETETASGPQGSAGAVAGLNS